MGVRYMGDFTLYAAGTGPKACKDVMREIGYNQLLSQLNERNSINEWVEYLKNHPDCKSKLFIDSGAFSAHTKGKVVDVDDYINYINSIDDYVYIFAQVDHIPGRFGQPKTPEELAEAPKLSWDNYLYMVDKVKSRDKLLPIYHQGEDIRWLKNMLEYTHPDGKHIWYIGISPANDQPVSEKIKWLTEVYDVIAKSSNPNVKTHAFGMTSLNVLEQFPFTSADSTTWLITAANGSILLDGKVLPVSRRRENNPANVVNRSIGLKDDIEKRINALGYTLDELADDDLARHTFNLKSLKDWLDKYTYKGTTVFQNKLW